MLPGKARVVGITELIGARSAKGNAVAIERDSYIFAINVADDEFTNGHRSQEF
jgi:hypothetical protein